MTEYPPEVQAIVDRIPTTWGSRHLSIGPGWYSIVVALDRAIAALYPDYEVHQVKEKFGGLRYYCEHSSDPAVQTLVYAAEKLTATTCESCGTTERVTTRCTVCHNKPTKMGRF